MKQILFFVVLFLGLSISRLQAQEAVLDLPASSLIPHFRLSINYNTTTVLVFRAPIKPVDRGDRDIIAQKQPGVENVLKLKAARKNFQPTNLHVFTADGRMYAFNITYTDSLATTHDLSGLLFSKADSSLLPVISLSLEGLNSDWLTGDIEAVKSLPVYMPVTSRSYRMKFQLENISLKDHLLFFRLGIVNRSNLDYTINFVRMYVRDRRRAKRSSVQEQEILPAYQDSAVVISGKSKLIHIMAVPAFTFSNNKELIIELYEKNGGRYLTLTVRNKHLFRAKNL